MNAGETTSYPTEFLKYLELPGTLTHQLQLKVGVPVILLSNIHAPKLCNGTRLRKIGFGHNKFQAMILNKVFPLLRSTYTKNSQFTVSVQTLAISYKFQEI